MIATGDGRRYLREMELAEDGPMLDLTIHDIDETVLDRLRARAARKGISLEEEARRTIADHVAGDAASSSSENNESAWDAIRRLRDRAGGGVDFEPLDRSEWKDRPVDFGE